MCELFGASSIEKAEYKDLLREFYSHDMRNPNGWGIAVREGDRLLVKKEPVRASASEILAGIMERPIRNDLLLAHVRLATKGSIEYENTHPFVQKDVSGQTWTLIHNGTIFESSILDQYVNRQVGSTDSERILCHLIARMNTALRETGTPLTTAQRFGILQDLIVQIVPENKVNVLLTDGETLYAHSNYKGGLHIRKEDGSVIISTQALDGGCWEELPRNTLLAYRDGEEILRGEPHEFEFFDSEEKMRYLYLDFAGI